MITQKIIGGLGNQMFQYAFIKALSLKHDTNFNLDISGYSKYKLHNYSLESFNIQKQYALKNKIPFYEHKNSNNKYINLILTNLKGICKRLNIHHYIEKQFNFNKTFLYINNGYIEGYFQTEKYFKNFESEIRKDFTFKLKPSKKNQECINIIEKCNSISIHIRRGDYISNKNANNFHGTCNLDYYKKAIELIKTNVENPIFFFFSDDITWVKENLKIDEEKYFVDWNNTDSNYEDIRLMSLCKHNIIANSSFSWWGAWLNKNKEKIVIAPEKWFNNSNNNYSDIIPNKWLKIKKNEIIKLAFFWDILFENNNFYNIEIDKNLSPFYELVKYNGYKNTISLNLLNNYNKKHEFIILCFLTFSIFTIKDYIKLFIKYPKNKKYLFLFEPKIISPLSYNKILHKLFNKIFTRNDNIIDDKKYFKFIWPQSQNNILNPVVFKNKKLLTLINGNHNCNKNNELYSERKKIIEYLEKNNIEFDLYGRGWNKPINIKEKIFGFKYYKSYKGSVKNKINTISKYKFNICFENMKDTPGYITEKIWDSFKAKTIPIYWGASNIQEYIPENCYIDYRKFNGNYDKLIKFIFEMDEIKYNKYINNINDFLKTEKAKKWFDKQRAIDFINNL